MVASLNEQKTTLEREISAANAVLTPKVLEANAAHDQKWRDILSDGFWY
jgi:hypothetical protein